MPRIFVAIDLSPQIKKAIAAHIQQLRQEWPKATIGWVRPENLHLTLKFIGEVPAERLNDIANAVERAIIGCTPFTFDISGSGAFPVRGTPRVLWIGVTANRPLSRLHTNLEKELAEIGIPREAKDFHPHLTVGRVRASTNVREVSELHRGIGYTPHKLSVGHVSVIESTLAHTGAVYSERSKHKLRAE